MHARFLLTLLGCNGATAVGRGYASLLEEEGNLAHLVLVARTERHTAQCVVVAADDFVVGGFAASLVVADAKAHHVDAHIGGRLVGVVAVDAFEEGVENGEYLDVAVVVDGQLIVRLHVEGVNHINIVKVGRGGLVGDIHGVLERQIPHGEGLKFGITCFDAALVLLVQLTEADRHLTATGARGCDDDQRARGFDIIVATEAVLRINEGHVGGVAVNRIMIVSLDAEAFEFLAIEVGAGLAVVVGDDDRTDQEATLLELGA